MDGVVSLTGVTVVAATNRPDLIDRALLRPGRLDRVVYVPLPDLATRRQVFAIHTRKMPLAPDVDLDQLAIDTENYSGAEIAAVCNEAALAALEEDPEAWQVAARHFILGLGIVTPRIRPELLEIYAEFQKSEKS
jgi:AAA family ATPase